LIIVESLEAFEKDGVKKYFNLKQHEDKRTKLQRYVQQQQQQHNDRLTAFDPGQPG